MVTLGVETGDHFHWNAQPELEREVRGYVEAPIEEDLDRPEIQDAVTWEEGHGRVENRRYLLSTDFNAVTVRSELIE